MKILLAYDGFEYSKHALEEAAKLEAETKIRHGDPAEELIREATEGGYDVAVAGSRGLGPVGQLVLGSVSRKLVKGMPCPVVVAGPETTVRHEPGVVAR